MEALEQIGGWGAAHAAAAVVSTSGLTAVQGDEHRPFALASVTKLLTAYAVLVATEEGVVDLDAPAGPPGSTLRHLLAHASGLAPDEPHAMAGVAERRIYSNSGFEAAAAELERGSGLPFADYLREGVVEPLSMTATALRGSPAWGAESTVADLTRFVGELLTPTLVAPGTLASATAVAFPGLDGVLPGFGRQAPNDWGIGFELRDAKRPHWTGSANSPRTFGHFGRSGTFLWVDPDRGLGLVALTDRAFGPWAAQAWPALSDAVLGDV